MRVKLIIAAVLMVTSISLFSQARPAANEGGLPIVVGVGLSDYYTDWAGRLGGPTVWVDFNLHRNRSLLNGLGIELEGRDLNYIRTGPIANLRQDTAEGGPIYTWRHYRNVHPYGKFLLGIGSIDFTLRGNPSYTHDTRTVYAPGGGSDFRVWRNFWVRGDYEYQFWPRMFNGHTLNPQGFTIGAEYDLRRMRGR